jgi:hypothetical protein
MSITSLNEKYGMIVDGLMVAGIAVGIAMVSTAVVTAVGIAAGVVSAVQVLIIRNESA